MHQKAQIQGLNKLEEDQLNAQVAPGTLKAPILGTTSGCTRA